MTFTRNRTHDPSNESRSSEPLGHDSYIIIYILAFALSDLESEHGKLRDAVIAHMQTECTKRLRNYFHCIMHDYINTSDK